MKEKEIRIPDFLKPCKNKKRKELSKFDKLVDEYQKKFDDNPPTEPYTYSKEKWCKILEVCIKENITFEELFGEEYDPDWDY